jgi:uridine kinase
MHLPQDIRTIGIAGGTASGKTTFVAKLCDHFGLRATVLRMDDYYKDCSLLKRNQDGQYNFDSLEAVDVELFANHLNQLSRGIAVDSPVYDFGTHSRLTETQRVRPCPLVIAEGIMVLAEPRIRTLLDLSIFVTLDDDLRLIRRLSRDVQERDRTVEAVLEQWQATVKPFHDQVVAPSATTADIIVSANSFDRVCKLLI